MANDDGRVNSMRLSAQTSMRLSAQTLGSLDARISVPDYDRSALRPGIVHIGVGGFHRAHQAVYLDELCRGGLRDWSIVGAGVLPGDRAIADALEAQDYLYTLITRDSATTHVRVIGSIVDYDLAHPSIEPLVARLVDPATRLVTMTITEGGYPVDESTGAFVPAPDGTRPATFEALARALQLRRDGGLGGLTVLSCDNIMHNGVAARTATLGVADEIEPGLGSWIADTTAFPNAMVDRITPVTSDADRESLLREYGLADRWPVVAETFIQWVIEDDFPHGRPPYEDAGALFTSDVTPYETLKLRLLNAGHSTLAYLAALADHTYVHEVMADAPFGRFLRRFLDDEASPSLPAVPGIDVEDYKRTVVGRFANPEVRDQVARICLDGSSKFPKFLIPTIESQLDHGGQVGLSALALAGWCQYLVGRDDRGRDISISSDPDLDAARAHARASVSDPAAFLGFAEVFGARLPKDPTFVAAFTSALRSLRGEGLYPTLAAWSKDAT